MIKKLRNKFILINMALVSAVLLALLAVLCISSYRKYTSDADVTLEMALREDGQALKPVMELPPGEVPRPIEDRQPENRSLVFLIETDQEGEILMIEEGGMQVSEEAAQEVLLQVQESGEDAGILYGFQIRFKKQQMQNGERIAFMDCSREISGMRSQILVSVLTFIGSMLAFLVISFFLAKWALAPVEKAWEQQRRFIADASHELKTPLTVILANLSVLSTHREDTIAAQEKWLINTDMEAKRMQKLLENLLFLARSDAVGTPMNCTEIDLSNLLWSCILPFESLAYENGVTLVEEIDTDIRITGDEGQLRQLAAILMDNACKYVEKNGTITVRLKKQKEKVCLSVSNTGITIPQEEIGHIFERFYRVDKSRARKENGYGLGLSIAETIVHNHHGKIRAACLDGCTEFTVSLPGE